jgi:putative polysaccharide biosynthesis protein
MRAPLAISILAQARLNFIKHCETARDGPGERTQIGGSAHPPRRYSSGIGETRIPLIIVLGTVVLNFALDPLFIFGWGPVSGHGVMGAALATLITQALASLIGMMILLRGHHGIQLSWGGLIPDPPYLKRAFLLGFPGSVELSSVGSVWWSCRFSWRALEL